ncbi:hypothetical protein Y032_0048g1575 [Ancylostoma ceylanicum]|uniref:Uncharacterized protein n=1 Tax=Ancylostoma ceylanicum TaxID=53326 RepID=A0A016U9S6_9BILA|nr:hypothetical protein Y032_0048g1575 [Ancylostoma ceylanicum]
MGSGHIWPSFERWPNVAAFRGRMWLLKAGQMAPGITFFTTHPCRKTSTCKICGNSVRYRVYHEHAKNERICSWPNLAGQRWLAAATPEFDLSRTQIAKKIPFLLLMIRCMRLVKHARAVLTAATKHSLDYASKKNVQPAVPSQLNKLHAFLL